MNHVFAFFLGVAASLLATYIAYLVVAWRRRGKASKLEGYWAESVLNSDRPVSVCLLRYQQGQGFKFSGTNYFPDGREYCSFSSEAVVFDWKALRMFYIYRFWRTGLSGQHTYGYGWMDINDEGAEPVLADGHYRSSDPESVARHSRMKSLAEAAAEVELDLPEKQSEEWRADFVRCYAAKQPRANNAKKGNA